MAKYDHIFCRDILSSIVKGAILAGFSVLAGAWAFKRFGPWNDDQRRNAKAKAVHKLELLGKNKVKLTEYELLIASNLVVPDDIDVTWKEIAGLKSTVDEIKETVILPIVKSKYFKKSKLTKPPKGVLLHGPPGCGKTLIAKATAKEAAASFISLDVSLLFDKWYGESQKLVTAVFSLAEKLQPSIIFIDEIDSLLRSRNQQDHEATAMIKTQFMLLWDGICTDPSKMVIIMGATNRPQDIDQAILRRMSAIFKIPLPNKAQRQEILQLILSGENTQEIDYEELGNRTNNFSGSDLSELCRNAALYRIRECEWNANPESSVQNSSEEENFNLQGLRPITMGDMLRALSFSKEFQK